MARGIKDANIGKAIPEALGDIPAVQYTAQLNVGEQDIELLIGAIKKGNRLLAAAGLDHRAAIVNQVIDNHHAHEMFVFTN